MDRKRLINDAKRSASGHSFMTVQEFMEWLGVSRSTAERKIRSYGLDKIDNKYYFIPDIVDGMLGKRS